MKTSTLAILLMLISILAISQEKKIARVQKVSGVEVYILCQPIRTYEIVNGKGNSIKWGSFFTGGLVNASISNKISKFVKGLRDNANEEGFEFDAVLYTSGKNVTIIKFTDEATDQNRYLAKVQEMNGIPIFVMNEPVANYDVITEMGPGLKWKSLLTAGLVNNSIEQDMKKFIKKSERNIKKNKIHAIQYSSGKRAIGIKFEEL